MIDTHAHIYAEQFLEDLDETINRAKESGVKKILLPNIDSASLDGMNSLVTGHPGFFYKMVGLHPCSVNKEYLNELAVLEAELGKNDCIAIGEIGIDLYWDKTTLAEQTDAFKIQCNWAIERNLPIAIHSREATEIILDILEQNFAGKITGVFHCFTGTEDEAKRIVDLGMYVGIGGVVTFKNTTLREVLKSVDLSRVILETDSPYLAPMPFRGKRNESSYLVYIARTLSEVYGISEHLLVDRTTENALKLFKL
jgi:TatD DNase family protein